MPTHSHFAAQYGRGAFVGVFAATAVPRRGDAVVLRTPRGVELGAALGPAPAGGAAGDCLRAATDADLALAAERDTEAEALLAAASARAAGLPLQFVDAECPLDGPAVLHAVAWGACDADPLLAELARDFGSPVHLLDLARLPPVPAEPPAKGCGKPNCGSGGGCGSCGTEKSGCGTGGGCSRGAVKGADELTGYFRDLRAKMEAAGMGRLPLQ